MSWGPQIGRLAMRQEGSNWNAYYALPDTMQDAILLGHVQMAFVANRPDRMEAFLDMMREAVGDIIEEKTGVRPFWGNPKSAPESEKSGNA